MRNCGERTDVLRSSEMLRCIIVPVVTDVSKCCCGVSHQKTQRHLSADRRHSIGQSQHWTRSHSHWPRVLCI